MHSLRMKWRTKEKKNTNDDDARPRQPQLHTLENLYTQKLQNNILSTQFITFFIVIFFFFSHSLSAKSVEKSTRLSTSHANENYFLSFFFFLFIVRRNWRWVSKKEYAPSATLGLETRKSPRFEWRGKWKEENMRQHLKGSVCMS